MNTLKFFGSLRLTLVSLGLMMTLVFFGTLAQVQIGTFAAQKEFFSSVFIYRAPFGFRMPVLPGGFLVGGLWLINLIAAFVFQFRFVKKKIGLLISHSGLILLLGGQFLAQTLAHESQMPIEVGKSANYSESSRDTELVFIDGSDSNSDQVTSIPQSRLRHAETLTSPALPFQIKVAKFFANAHLAMAPGGVNAAASNGVGARVTIDEIPPVSSDNETNNVSVVIEPIVDGKSLGTWLASTGLGAPQSINVNGRDYAIALRPRRTYYPLTLHLKEFKHDIYPGTDIPKNFSSLVRLVHPQKNEDRDVLIYMNHPLRYDGKTFFQASFANNDTVSIFQVVDNPAWTLPYISCSLVVLGLAIHFLMSLTAFVRKRS